MAQGGRCIWVALCISQSSYNRSHVQVARCHDLTTISLDRHLTCNSLAPDNALLRCVSCISEILCINPQIVYTGPRNSTMNSSAVNSSLIGPNVSAVQATIADYGTHARHRFVVNSKESAIDSTNAVLINRP